MAMSATTLKNALLNMDLAATPEEAVVSWTDAYATFASEAVAALPTPLPLLPAGLSAGKEAMAPILAGMDQPGAALAKIPAAIIEFWKAVALGLSASFAGATAIVPPPHASIVTDFAQVAASNISEERTAEEAMAAIAEIMYNNAVLGGVVTVTTPTGKIE